MFSINLFIVTLWLLDLVSGQEMKYYPSHSEIEKNITSCHKSIYSRNINLKLEKRSLSKSYNVDEMRIFRHLASGKNTEKNKISKRSTDAVFRGHPKTKQELWNLHFLNQSKAFDQTPSLIKLIHNLTMTYLNECLPVILYDSETKNRESNLFQNLFIDFPVAYVHGYVNKNNVLEEPKLLKSVEKCHNYILFLTDVKFSATILGKQAQSKVVVVATRSSQWAVHEFLTGPLSRMFVNLLVIGQSFKDGDDETLEAPYILYTHKLYTDGLGASTAVVLNSWSHGKFSRNVNLFTTKMTHGFAGHRFVVAAANQPPFVIRRVKTDSDGGNPRVVWDGVEIRLLRLLAARNNFSIEIIEPRERHSLSYIINIGGFEVHAVYTDFSKAFDGTITGFFLGSWEVPESAFSIAIVSGDAVAKEITSGRADIGIAGIYITTERAQSMDLSYAHSQDCAAFITLMSTALPRYRAILGPFHWHVWVALTFTYLIGIFPLAFSDKHTLSHLLHNSGEVENMFWYVFGTFTNCFTFVGKNSWSKTTKITTRLLIGWYWVFTIIITSCYTGSIIAFVTLPVFPSTVDSIKQLLAGFYRIGTLDRGGWETWFTNSSDKKTNDLLKKVEFVRDVQSGIRNTTKAFFWPYAFLGSRAELDYIIKSNYTKTESKRAMLHISNECFVLFGVTVSFPNNSVYTAKLSADISRIIQSGLLNKIVGEVRWAMLRSSTGKLLSAGKGTIKIVSAEEKALTLEDTQGMFLLLGAGFLIAATSLVSELIGGFSRRCCCRRKREEALVASKEAIVSSPKLELQSETKINDDDVYKPTYVTRDTSADSLHTLDGEVINVSKESITVHEIFGTDEWDSRGSSTIDVDKEVQQIFESGFKRKRILSDGVITKPCGGSIVDASK